MPHGLTLEWPGVGKEHIPAVFACQLAAFRTLEREGSIVMGISNHVLYASYICLFAFYRRFP
jgi:hypothetical protein